MGSRSKKAAKGIIWSGLERFSTQGAYFVISLILARILAPEDFGVIALTNILIVILQSVNESGFNVALMNKLNRDELDYSSVFIANLVLGLFLYLILFLSAPAIATFFKLEELIILVRILGLNLILRSLIIVQEAIFTINLDFKTQTKASLVAVTISGIIGVLAAFQGLGVWSLVIQVLTYSSFNGLILWLLSTWKPRKMEFSILRMRALFNFAYKLILARLINVIFLQVFSLIIGKFYTAAQLGFYNRAKSFEELLTNNITGIIQRVSTPMLCDEQNDKHRLAQLLMKFIVSTALLVYPMLFGLFVLAKPLVLVLLTEKWLPAVWILQVLCPVGLLYVLNTFNLNVFNATGRTDWALKVEVVKKSVFVAVIVLAFSISFEALVISQIFIAMIELWINSYFTKKQINLTLVQQLSGVKGILFISGFMAACIFIVTILIPSDILKLIIGFITGIIAYSGLIYVFNINNSKETLRVIVNNYRRSEY